MRSERNRARPKECLCRPTRGRKSPCHGRCSYDGRDLRVSLGSKTECTIDRDVSYLAALPRSVQSNHSSDLASIELIFTCPSRCLVPGNPSLYVPIVFLGVGNAHKMFSAYPAHARRYMTGVNKQECVPVRSWKPVRNSRNALNT